MSTQQVDYEQLRRDAITQARAGAPRVAEDLQRCASQAAEAITKVTDGAAALELIPVPVPDGAPATFQLHLRRVGREAPPSDLGVYQLSDAGYPIQRWYSRGAWESSPDQSEQLYQNMAELEGHFRWMVSDPSARLVVLVAFILQQARENADTGQTSA
jgi:hypothetical protein